MNNDEVKISPRYVKEILTTVLRNLRRKKPDVTPDKVADYLFELVLELKRADDWEDYE
jgi:hypothetical protein